MKVSRPAVIKGPTCRTYSTRGLANPLARCCTSEIRCSISDVSLAAAGLLPVRSPIERIEATTCSISAWIADIDWNAELIETGGQSLKLTRCRNEHEVGLEADDPFEIWMDCVTNLLFRAGLGREIAIARDSRYAIPQAECVESSQ